MELVHQFLLLLKTSCSFLVDVAIDDNQSPRDSRDTFVEGILTISTVTKVDSPLRQALLLCLLLEMKTALCVPLEKEAAEGVGTFLLFLYYMIEQVAVRTGKVSDVIKGDIRRLLWETIVMQKTHEMKWKDEIIWKVCGLLDGFGGLNLLTSM